MATQLAKGTQFVYDPQTLAQTLTGNLVGEYPERQWDEEDVTDLSTSTPAKDFDLTLYDEGSYGITLHYDKAIAAHVSMRDLGRSGAVAEFDAILPDSIETRRFQAFVKNWKWITNKGEKLKATFQLRQTGTSVFS